MIRLRRAVDLLARRADRGGGDGRLLGGVQHVVGLGDVGCDVAGVHTTGGVGAVPGHRAAEVEQHDLALTDHP